MTRNTVVASSTPAQKSTLYSALTTLTILVIVGFSGFGVWWLLSKIMPILGVIYAAVIVVIEFRNLLAVPKFQKATQSLNQAVQEMAETAMTPKEGRKQLSENAAWGFASLLTLGFILLFFFHFVLSTVLVFSYGKIYTGHFVALLGLLVSGLYVVRALIGVGNIYNAVRDPNKVNGYTNRLHFWISTIWFKLHSLVALIFFALLLAGNYGFFIGF